MKMRKGQAMIIAILTLGGAILGATSLAGLVTLYQIRSTTDSENSAKAIFAADSGISWALYSYFGGVPEGPEPTFSNSATLTVICYKADGTTESSCDNSASTTSVAAEGSSNGARREFVWDLADATGTLP